MICDTDKSLIVNFSIHKNLFIAAVQSMSLIGTTLAQLAFLLSIYYLIGQEYNLLDALSQNSWKLFIEIDLYETFVYYRLSQTG